MASYQIGGTAVNHNCITGGHDHFYHQLKEAIRRAVKIEFNVSFLMTSGVRLIREDLAAAAGVPVTILCANYLNITQPDFLYSHAESKEFNIEFYIRPIIHQNF